MSSPLRRPRYFNQRPKAALVRPMCLRCRSEMRHVQSICPNCMVVWAERRAWQIPLIVGFMAGGLTALILLPW